jgi:hypothetical protein
MPAAAAVEPTEAVELHPEPVDPAVAAQVAQ